MLQHGVGEGDVERIVGERQHRASARDDAHVGAERGRHAPGRETEPDLRLDGRRSVAESIRGDAPSPPSRAQIQQAVTGGRGQAHLGDRVPRHALAQMPVQVAVRPHDRVADGGVDAVRRFSRRVVVEPPVAQVLERLRREPGRVVFADEHHGDPPDHRVRVSRRAAQAVVGRHELIAIPRTDDAIGPEHRARR